MKAAARTALALALILTAFLAVGLSDAQAHTNNVLVYAPILDEQQGTEGNVAAAVLRSLGYTVTVSETLPPDLSPYTSVWVIRAFIALYPDEDIELAEYVKGGGRLYLTGTSATSSEEINESDQIIAGAVLKNQQVLVGSQGASPDNLRFNPAAENGATRTPHLLNRFLANWPGRISGLRSRNILASDGTHAVGALFDERDMQSGQGRLVIYMDINWLQENGGAIITPPGPYPPRLAQARRNYSSTDQPGLEGSESEEEATFAMRQEIVENLQDFLEKTPGREPPATGEYTALGDSYAAGVGSFSYLPHTTGTNGCYRATNGYAEQIATHLGLSLAFPACIGARIGNLWEGKDPQLGHVGPRTRLVTLSIGGNDVGFKSVLQSCVDGLYSAGGAKGCAERDNGAAETALEWLRHGRPPGTYELPGENATSTNAVPLPSLLQLYEDIFDQSPYTELVVIGYPKLFESARSPLVDCQVGTVAGIDKLAIYASDIEWILHQTDAVNQVIEEAVALEQRAAKNIRFVDPRPTFVGHGICDSEASFIHALLFKGLKPIPKVESFHPTVEGQEALRQLIEEIL
ncbi:MAG TPA: GDSL-type esterase/lipase family protein [Solirubrobacteraceae bacterium]|nr:GDSL-type esterase/lipase family protein [Solirubrobacteraceae bacterium]